MLGTQTATLLGLAIIAKIRERLKEKACRLKLQKTLHFATGMCKSNPCYFYVELEFGVKRSGLDPGCYMNVGQACKQDWHTTPAAIRKSLQGRGQGNARSPAMPLCHAVLWSIALATWGCAPSFTPVVVLLKSQDCSWRSFWALFGGCLLYFWCVPRAKTLYII